MDSFSDFQIIKKIKSGSMGVVYQARMADGREVAIKTFTMLDTATDQEQERLHKLLAIEARRAMGLEHPNIIKTFDYVDNPDETAPYIVMEYVDSPNLSEYLEKNSRVEPGVIINLLRQAASALDYSARMDLIHRDVKPANMLITGNGTGLKLIDFGIAKRIREGSVSVSNGPSLSETHSRVGTLPYMAPEQITEPTKVTEKIDQYALASVAYLLLTGRTVFEDNSSSDASLTNAIVHKAPPMPTDFNGKLNSRVNKVMRRALSKKPGGRYPDCGAFVAALEEAVFSEKAVFPIWARVSLAGLVLGGLLIGGIYTLSDHSVTQVASVDPPQPPRGYSGATGQSGPGSVIARADAPPPLLPPPPVDPVTLGLSVYSRTNKLPAGKEFAYKDPDLGQLDGRELTAHVTVSGRLPRNAKVAVDWLVDGGSVGSQDLVLNGDSSGVQVAYPNPIPLPGDYTVRLSVSGQKSKEFKFKITQ